MAKSLVEKYEQILNQDPGSMVFVELSKALIDRGEYQRAIDTCRAGIEHHPDSIVGRVLWGKALIHAGKPADAMEQFDQAVAIERDNPHAYNLIGEVLLHRGLYRSAIPILRKAVALQPQDVRIRQWLEQAQRALEGGPAPVIADPTTVDPPRTFESGPNSVPETAVPGAGNGPGRDETISGITDVFRALQPSVRSDISGPSMSWEAPPTPLPDTPFPPASVERIAAAADPSALETETDIPISEPSVSGQSRTISDPNAPKVVVNMPGAKTSGPNPWDVERKARSANHPVPAMEVHTAPIPGAPARGAPAPGVPPPLPPKRSGVLGAIPDFAAPPIVTDPSTVVPKVDVTPETAAAIAQEYERELREKLLAPPPETFLRKHWVKLAVSAVAIVAGVGGTLGYRYTQAKNKGRDVVNTLAEAQRALVLDTLPGYRHALDEAAEVLDMSSSEERAVAIQAFANAVLVAEYGGDADVRQKAVAAAENLKSEASQRALVATQYYLADELGRTRLMPDIERLTAGKPAPGWATAELLYIRARRLLAKGGKDGETAALGLLQNGFEAERAHVRTLLAFADYYQGKGDANKAFEFYSTGGDVSPDNPRVAIGLAETRVTLSRNLDQAFADVKRVEAGTGKEPLPPTLKPRLDLVMGRLLSLRGDYQAASTRLADGASNYREHAPEFYEALGDAHVNGGYFDRAAEAYTKASDAKKGDVELKIKAARALVDAGRLSDAIRHTEAAGDERKLHLVRGIARYELRDYRRARTELESTRREGKVLADAAIYLALADLAEGNKNDARDKIVAAAKAMGNKPLAQVAMGRLDEADGKPADASRDFGNAAQDPRDYEGSCSLGRLLLAEGRLGDAEKSLGIALQRNHNHAEALGALAELAFVRGDLAKARALYEQAANAPEEKLRVAIGVAGLARVAAAEGRLPEARRNADKAGKLDGNSVQVAAARAYVANAVGDAGGAQRLLERAIKLAPDDPAPACALGMSQWSTHETSAAEKTFTSALDLGSHPACATIGAALLDGAHNLRSALKVLDLTAEASPRDRAEADGAKAYLLAAAGDLSRARKEAEKASTDYPGSGLAHLAAAMATHNDAERTRKELETAITLDPSLAHARFMLAEILARDEATQPRAILEYEAFARMAPKAPAAPAAKKVAQALRKKVASR